MTVAHEDRVAPGAQRRQAIAQAAIQVLATQGLGALSMAAVAHQSGLAKSVVLYHVRDRQGLLTLVTDAIHQARHLTDAPLSQADGDPRQHLGTWLNCQFDAAERLDAPIRLGWILQFDTESALAGNAGRGSDRNVIYRLAQLLARGHAQACWHAPDALRLATSVKALTDGFLLQALAHRENPKEFQKLRAMCRGAVLDLLVR